MAKGKQSKVAGSRRRLDYAVLGSLRQVQLAKILGVTGPAVTAWGKRGCPRNDDGTYDLVAVVGWIRGGAVDLHRLPQRAVLEVLDITRPTIGQWAGRGCGRNVDGTYDLAVVVKWRLDELQGRIAAARQEIGRGRARREMAQAELAEMALAERRGELLPRGPVVAGWIARYQVVKSMLLGLVRRARGQYGLDRDQVRHIDDDVKAMLGQLGRAQPALQLKAAEARILLGKPVARKRRTKRAKGGTK